MNDLLIPLGGGDEIGASCYYIRLGTEQFLLDCGARVYSEQRLPEFSELLYHCVSSCDELTAVILSHAHFDHIGGLTAWHRRAPRVPIYATGSTKQLTELQLVQWDRDQHRQESRQVQDMRRANTYETIAAMRPLSYRKPLKLGQTTVRLYPSGHMQGAAMVSLSAPTGKVLYTGDISRLSAQTIQQLQRDDAMPDTLICSATYAYRPGEAYKPDFQRLEKAVRQTLCQGHSVLLRYSNLGKLVDCIHWVNNTFDDVPVYLDEGCCAVAEALEGCGCSVYSDTILPGVPDKRKEHILISCMKKAQYGYNPILFDHYSNHLSYSELKQAVIELNAKQTYLVHTQPKERGSNLLTDLWYQPQGLRGSVEQAVNGTIYEIG